MDIKVLMFGWEFPPHNSGGLGTACKGLARALVSENVDLTFVLPKRINIDEDWLRVIFAGVKNIHMRPVDTFLIPYMTPDDYVNKRFFSSSGIYAQDLFGEVLRYAELAGNIALEQEYDVIHAHEWLAFPAGIRAKEITGKPLILHVHSTEYDRSAGNVNPEVFALEKEAFEKADNIVAVSGFTKNILVEHYGINQNMIEVVYNGVDTPDHVAYPHDVPEPEILQLKKLGYKIVLYVGRFSMHKGPDYFLKAAKKVIEYEKDVVFIMAGSGEMEYKLVELAADLDISSNVIFAGYLRGSELSQIYASADLYVLPSVSEPFGIAPLESLMHKTPVIISKQSGVSEILAHALKVDFWDVDELSNKIITSLRHPELLEELQHGGHEQALRFNWKEAAKKVINVYKRLLG